MRSTIKSYLSMIIALFYGAVSYGQIENIQLELHKELNSGLYIVKMIVTDGSATGPINTIQFNSQVSIVVPTGTQVTKVENFAPFKPDGNPLNWSVAAFVVSPEVTPNVDYYSITPTLSPTARYEDLEEGDVVDLFSLSLPDACDMKPRLFNAVSDPKPNDEGMGGADFTVGFTIGGVASVYGGIHFQDMPNLQEFYCEGDESPLTVLPINAVWVSSDDAVASVTNAGVLQANGPGNAQINYTDLMTGCSSDIVEVTVLPATDSLCLVSSVEEFENVINIYPSPAADYFEVEGLTHGTEIMIYHENGKLVHKALSKTSKMSIDCQSWPKGMYIMVANIGDQTFSKKVAKL